MSNISRERVGTELKYRVDGVPPIVIGRIEKKNLKQFYTSVGFHIKTDLDSSNERSLANLYSTIKIRIKALTSSYFTNMKYNIVDIIIPESIQKNNKGYMNIEIYVNSKVDVPVDDIKDFNLKIIDVILGIEDLTIFSTNKY